MLLESLNVVADASCALSITYTSSSELACIKVPEVVQTEELQSNLRCRLFDGAKADFTRPLLAFFQTLLTELQQLPLLGGEFINVLRQLDQRVRAAFSAEVSVSEKPPPANRELNLTAMSLSLLKFVGQASLVDDAMLPS